MTAARAQRAEIRLRPATGADTRLLFDIYASTRGEELAAFPWPDAVQTQFLQMQFRAQAMFHAQRHPDARHDVIEVDGIAAGRLMVERREGELAVIDIALLPEYRGRGIGTMLLGELLAEAADAELDVTLHVATSNHGALALYRRLGFVETSEAGMHRSMRRGAAATTAVLA